ncbi:MAG: HipA domain-containing protein [Byssovorax sp.]
MTLRVLLGNDPVGTIERQEHGRTVFRFDRAYLEMPERPVLGRWFEDRLGPSFEYVEQGNRLPPFFQNYLPEEHSALRTLLARRAGVKRRDEVPLLAALGEDLPGAIVVRAAEPGALSSDDTSPDSPLREQGTPRLRFSLAGMQLKFSVLESRDRFTLPVSGLGGKWIAKLPDRRYARVPENECSMLTWARAIGIDVPDFRLVPVTEIEGLPPELHFAEPNALVVRRYDRGPGDERIHQEDFAQVLGKRPVEDEKYGSASSATLAKIVRLVCGEGDYEALIRRLVFVVLSGNADAHLKNWSLVYPDRRRPRLSPAYDLVCTFAYGQELDQGLALNLSREKDFTRITLKHFERLAEKVGAPPARTREIADESAARARGEWRRLRGELPMSDEAKQALDRHLGTLAL